MLKRYTSIFALIIFIFTLVPFTFNQKVHAYTSNSYFNNLKIGLASMSAASITISLNGDYTLNGQTYSSGTVMNLAISGTNIIYNGITQSEINLIPNNSSNLLTMTSGAVSNKYMGAFLIKVYNAKILPINTLDMENYLKGVVGYEMSDYFPIESLKAQTVAARNYALSRIGYEAAKGYDFDDTISYQVYKGYNASYTNVITAVEQTKGQVLLYNDKLVETLYSAWHGGVSENSENVWGNIVPYLKSVQDTYENDPWPNGARILTNAQILSTLITKGYLTSTDTFIKLDLSSITKFASGRVSNVNIIYKNVLGLTLTKYVVKDSTRTFLSLPSNLFTVTYDSINGIYTFSGKGNGHGLGMSQIGAKNRATAGQTYEQILKFYYTNTYLQNIILKASLSTLTQNSNNLFVGDTLSLKATATEGNGYGYLFKYVIKSGVNTIFTREYSSDSTLDFIPSNPGSYIIEAYVKDKFSISNYDDKKVSDLTVYSVPVVNTFTLNKTELIVGQSLVANIDAQGGSGSYLYKYEIMKDNTILATRDFGNVKEFLFTPDYSGNYVITTYVKDSISTKSYDFKESQNFNVFETLTFTSFTKDRENVFQGDTLNFSSIINGGSNKGVTYKFQVMKDGQVVATRDFDTNSNFTYVISASGNYEVEVYAVDPISGNPYDAFKKMNFVVKDRVSLTSLTTDRNSIFTNDTVTVNAITNSNNALYKFVILRDGAEVFTKDYDTNSILEYVPTILGVYQVNVYVKDSLSEAMYDDTKSLNITVYDYSELLSVNLDKEKLFKNDTIHFSADGIKGSNSYLYKFVISKEGTVITTKDYSILNTFDLIPNIQGNYSAEVYIKDSLSLKEYDDVKNLTFIVFDNDKIDSFQANKAAYLIGENINLNTTASLGSGNYLYKYVITKNGVVLSTVDYNASGSLQYTVNAEGAYSMTVYLKDVISKNEFDAQNTLSINVYNPQLSTITATGSFYEGKAVTLNASNTGSSPLGYSYKYEIYNNLTLVTSNSFNLSSALNFTATTAGNYTIKVYGKDGLSSKFYDNMKQFNVTINSKPLYLSVLPLKYGMTNVAVASLQNALVKLGYVISDSSGYFGTQTQNQVIAFQKSKGLTKDGIVGNMSYSALNDALIEKSGTKILTY
ncbi:MAG: SpoIID/LytB domain-containing protein [Clostridiaceae bacterium]|nr:SpoIID/LytB domain-containing protein [Clostridiaceae bacterium]